MNVINISLKELILFLSSIVKSRSTVLKTSIRKGKTGNDGLVKLFHSTASQNKIRVRACRHLATYDPGTAYNIQI